MTLVEFLNARMDEDAAVADASLLELEPNWVREGGRRNQTNNFASVSDGHVTLADVWDEESATHIARWNPARVLAEVEAKRQLLDELLAEDELPSGYDRRIQFLALPYADHDDYDEAWRP